MKQQLEGVQSEMSVIYSTNMLFGSSINWSLYLNKGN